MEDGGRLDPAAVSWWRYVELYLTLLVLVSGPLTSASC
jgi:hypothetical protein